MVLCAFPRGERFIGALAHVVRDHRRTGHRTEALPAAAGHSGNGRRYETDRSRRQTVDSLATHIR
jgi:hypothetical protein